MKMRCFWEQTGVLGPIYRALGQGLNNRDIARQLNLTEVNVQNCTDWILHFLNLRDREELVLYASAAV
jgi:DNA-binding NarL/FixJ family response regulator